MKHLKLIFACLLMAVLSIGQVWATAKSFTITFKDNGTDATTALTTSNFAGQNGQVASGGDSIKSVIATANCFAGNGGLKISSNNNNGSFQIKLQHALTIDSVVLNVKNKNATTSSVTIGKNTSFTTTTDFDTENFIDMKYKGTQTTSDSIKVEIGGTTNKKRVGYLASMTIYHTVASSGGGSTEPTVSVSPAELDFGTIGVGDAVPSAQEFTITGSNLTASALTVTSSSELYVVSVKSGSSLTPSSGSVSATIVVTPQSGIKESAGTKSATITVAGGGLAVADQKTVSASTVVKAKHTVTWNNNGVTSTSQVIDGEKPVFPATPASCDATSTTFIGWATAAWSGKAANLTGKTVYTSAASMPEVTADIEYFAVFAKGTSSATQDHDGPTWDRATNNTVSYTDGYTFSASASGPSNKNYYQDASSGVGDLKLYHTSTAIFSTTPSKVTLSAKIGGGSTQDPLDNSVRAKLLDKDGNAIGNENVITTKVTTAAGDDYEIDLDLTGITSAYGVTLYHEKESGYNVRYFSFGLSYTTGGTTYSDYMTTCTAAGTVATPTFSVIAGTYNVAKSVELNCETDGATIKYTTNGDTPDADHGTVYNGTAISVNESMTIKAYAYKDGLTDSEVASATYTLKCLAPAITKTPEHFLNSVNVTIASAGADHIYYTLDGSDPDNTKSKYTAPFSIDATKTVKAIAVKTNWSNSAVASETFTKANIQTVAQALTAIDALDNNGVIDNQYVSGVISQIDSYNSTYNSITYWVSVDGTTTNQLKVYGGLAGVVKSAFESVNDLSVGADVTIFGQLMKYVKNTTTTPEINANSVILVYKPKAQLAWSGTTAGVFEASLEGGNTFPTLTNSNSVTVEYGSSNTDAATINASTGEISLVGVGSTTITASFAGNSSFKANSVSYTLNVSSSVIKADISFEENGGSSVADLTDQSNLPNPLPAITKAGKNFGGWWTTETFEEGTEAVAGAAVESTDAITLYAKWLDPYTVTEALAIINALADGAQTESSLYVAGIVSTAPTAAPSSGKLTFYISVNGNAENQLQAYNCKDLNDEAFDAQDDIQVGDVVTIFGPLKKYIKNQEVVPEFNTGYLYSFNRPAKPTITADPAEVTNVVAEGVANQTIALTYENIENYLVDVTLHDDAAGETAFTGSWLTASVSDVDNYVTLTYSVAENDGAARIAYMKVYAVGDDDKEATKIIPVSQVEYVAPALPASLPFAFDGGREDIASTQGMSQDGLDADYSSAPKLKFKTTGTWVIVEIADVPGKLTYDILGNSFSGGTFKVQESANGTDYTDVATYTELGAKSSEEQTLLQTTRFVKFIYTEKVNGNVGLGNIAIAAPVAVEDPTFTPAGGEYDAAQSVTITCETTGATIYYTTNGDDPTDASTLYTAAISVEETMTIKAIAYKDEDHSEIASATYTITAPLTDYYEKVASGDVAEGTYLIVYETGSLAFNGGAETLDASSNTIAVDITNEQKIGVTSETEAATFYIDPTAGTIQAANGKYIGQSTDANGLTASDNALTNTLSIDESGDAVIVSAGGAYLRYNATSGQERFRYFKSSSYTNQQAIQLYKLHGEVIKPASGLAWDPADDIEITVGGTFTAPTLYNPNNIDASEITIESSNTDLATVTNGVVELVADATGTTTITATYTGETYKPITVSYKIKVNPAASIYVSPSLYVNFGSVEKDAALPTDKEITVTLNNVALATAVLGGTNPDAFSIDPASLTESGTITISVVSSATVANYSATLTISDEAGNAESKVVNLSFSVTDAEPSGDETPVSTTSKWVPATAIEDGMEVLITGVKNEDVYAMGEQKNNNRAAVAASVDGEGVLTPGENTMAFTLVAQGDGTYALRTSNGKYLYAAASGNNYLKTQDEVDVNAKWTMTVASASAEGSSNRHVMQFNTGSTLFSCYASAGGSGMAAIQFYVPKQATPEPVYETVRENLEVNRHYTVCLEKNITAIDGATFWNLQYKNAGNTEVYLVEETAPEAGKPYIFQATKATLKVVYGDEVAGAPVENGALRGTFDNMNADDLAGAGSNIYMLYQNTLRPLGNNNHLDAHRAYVLYGELQAVDAAPVPAPGKRVKSMPLQKDVATDIDAINASENPMKLMIDGQIYILRGGKLYDVTGKLVK